ncbi:MAG: Serine phosphatase RsbU, regulator of sigma subunit [uncultured Chloroflexia bacterium]|uniref:Serine phosphatase RsbU, regulator of sigma subunit n=1 Tax=uncultured Chloroflexia bacterium TaxID=1672391 RepID=A0A6J4NMZ0_9CHLR|nr:MAG: Serine phosphatase RsbU, regulator of sigma subunit [uncultured Chloroflexia bacterium]
MTLRDKTNSPETTVKHVLVVDDDPDINRLLRLRLSSRGYVVAAAASGEEALLHLRGEPVDLLFLDVSMPGISGIDVLEEIRKRELDVAVVMTTAFGSEQVAIEALRTGADDYLRKPFNSSEFQAVLQRTVMRLDLSRQNAALQQELDEKRLQLEVELSRAARVQAELLPTEVPCLPGFELAAHCIPAHEVGGDFYDWRMTSPDTFTLSLCDVMGKGMPAALMMATVRATMRAVIRQNLPATALQYVIMALGDDLVRAEQFVTCFLARLDVRTRQLTFVDAGHGHVFLRRADGSIEALSPRGLPLGVFLDETYEDGTLSFAPGDALILYSDGLVDARPDLNLEPPTIAQYLDGATSAEEMAHRLIALAAVAQPYPDDLTVVVLRCQQQPDSTPILTTN